MQESGSREQGGWSGGGQYCGEEDSAPPADGANIDEGEGVEGAEGVDGGRSGCVTGGSEGGGASGGGLLSDGVRGGGGGGPEGGSDGVSGGSGAGGGGFPPHGDPPVSRQHSGSDGLSQEMKSSSQEAAGVAICVDRGDLAARAIWLKGER